MEMIIKIQNQRQRNDIEQPREKLIITLKTGSIRWMTDFPQKLWRPEGSEIIYLQCWKIINQEFYTQQNYIWNMKDKLTHHPNKQKHKEFVPEDLPLRESWGWNEKTIQLTTEQCGFEIHGYT